MRFHVKLDPFTGEVSYQPMAATTDEEAIAELQQVIDDCPECQALRAAGEVPEVVRWPPPRASRRFRRPRWRDLKRRR